MTERPGASSSTDLDETEHGVPGGDPPVPPRSTVPDEPDEPDEPEAPEVPAPADVDRAVPDRTEPDEEPPVAEEPAEDEAVQDEPGQVETAEVEAAEVEAEATTSPDDAPAGQVVEPPTTPAPLPIVPAPAAPHDDRSEGGAPGDDDAAPPPAAAVSPPPPPAPAPAAGPAAGLAPAPAPDPGPAPSHRHLARAEEAEERRRRRRRVLRRTGTGAVVVLLVVATVASVYLYRTSEAWEDRAARYEGTAEELGADLAAARSTLAGTEAELEAVRGQLETAKARIIELADEKQQATDDREAQRQLAAYQDRVNDAAGRVALALDQCVQGQQQLIGYLQAQATAAEADEEPPYDASELEQFRTDVETLCQTASEANIALQRELDR